MRIRAEVRSFLFESALSTEDCDNTQHWVTTHVCLAESFILPRLYHQHPFAEFQLTHDEKALV